MDGRGHSNIMLIMLASVLSMRPVATSSKTRNAKSAVNWFFFTMIFFVSRYVIFGGFIIAVMPDVIRVGAIPFAFGASDTFHGAMISMSVSLPESRQMIHGFRVKPFSAFKAFIFFHIFAPSNKKGDTQLSLNAPGCSVGRLGFYRGQLPNRRGHVAPWRFAVIQLDDFLPGAFQTLNVIPATIR